LVGMGKGLACLHEILPAGSSRSPIPMIQWCTCFGIGSLCFFEKFPGDNAHASVRIRSDQNGHFVKMKKLYFQIALLGRVVLVLA
jgi:hypothetical protein